MKLRKPYTESPCRNRLGALHPTAVPTPTPSSPTTTSCVPSLSTMSGAENYSFLFKLLLIGSSGTLCSLSPACCGVLTNHFYGGGFEQVSASRACCSGSLTTRTPRATSRLSVLTSRSVQLSSRARRSSSRSYVSLSISRCDFTCRY